MVYAQQQDMYPAEDGEAAWEQRKQMIVRRCSPPCILLKSPTICS